jgi:hypothetical protein
VVRRTPQDGVDEPSPARSVGLGQLDGLADGGVRRHAIQKGQLKDPETERCENRWIELPGRPACERGDHVIERGDALDGAVGQLRGQAEIARIQPQAPCLAVQRTVGPGALLEHAPHDRVRADPRRRDVRDGVRDGLSVGILHASLYANTVF